MTDPTPTRDQTMMDLSQTAPAGMEDALPDKQTERDSTQEVLDDLAGLREDKIESEDEHKERIQKVQSKLDELDNVIKQKVQDMTKLKEQLENAKALKASPAVPPPTALIPSPVTTAPTASTCIDAKKPTMAGLADVCCRKEAWVGGKPNFNWTDLQLTFHNQLKCHQAAQKPQQPI